MTKKFVVLAGLLAVCSVLSQAAPVLVPIPGIVSSGAGLAEGAVDVNFLLISAPDGVPLNISPKVVRTTIDYGSGSQAAFPFWPGAWIPNSAESQWLGVLDSYSPPTRYAYGPADPSGWYQFRLTFVLPSSYAANNATISGSWMADNRGQLYLNGVAQPSVYTPPSGGGIWGSSTHSCAATDDQCFKAMHAFELTSGFVAGVNNLDFYVRNQDNLPYGNPAGFRVEMSGANYMVPEPSTVMLWAGGLIALALLRRRKAA
jgi:hypothetical protein